MFRTKSKVPERRTAFRTAFQFQEMYHGCLEMSQSAGWFGRFIRWGIDAMTRSVGEFVFF